MSCSSELTSPGLVNDQRLLARCCIYAVGHADVCPAVKLTDDLVEGDAAGDHPAHHFVRGHTWHTNVSSAPDAVLAGVSATYGVVDLLGPEGAVDHDGLAAKHHLDLLKHVGQSLEVFKFGIVGRVVPAVALG